LPIPLVSVAFASLFLSISFIVSIVVICQGYAGTGIAQILLNIIVSPILWFVGLAMFVGGSGAWIRSSNETYPTVSGASNTVPHWAYIPTDQADELVAQKAAMDSAGQKTKEEAEATSCDDG